jgi:hypothetical protein
VIDFNPHPEKAEHSIRCNSECASDEINDSRRQARKLLLQMILTFREIVIDLITHPRNAVLSIRVSSDSVSNKTEVTDFDQAKQDGPRT